MKKSGLILGLAAIVSAITLSFVSTTATTVTSVKIGKQEWTAKNLDVAVFNNGDPIPQAKTIGDWNKMENKGSPAWCYYDMKPENGKKYGRLYNWYAIADSRGIAPKGWHVATDEDWTELSEFLKDSVGHKLKSAAGWKNKGNGSNTTKFNALPGGYRDSYGSMIDEGAYANFWSATENGDYKAWSRAMEFNSPDMIRNNTNKQSGMYVRCVKNKK